MLRTPEELPASGRQIFCRRISNFDGETCWLNVILQMMLCLLDYIPHQILVSPLGKMLRLAQSQSFIDSREIKRHIQEEINRNSIRDQQIFTEQQCARDALVLLTENKELSWPDVYDMMHHVTKSSVTCQACHSESQDGARTDQLYAELDCPKNNTSMKETLETLYNHGEQIAYTCDTCKHVGPATKHEKIITEKSSNFLALLIKRIGTSYGYKFKATDDVTLLDSNNCPRVYTPISIIHHRGGFEPSPDSVRHYLCDVKFHDNLQWYRTNDALEAKLLDEKDVTRRGYIILYRRKIDSKVIKKLRVDIFTILLIKLLDAHKIIQAQLCQISDSNYVSFSVSSLANTVSFYFVMLS